SRSPEPTTFHALPERSVIPALSVTTSGNWAPATAPLATMDGFAVIVMSTWLFVPPGPSCKRHVAFNAHAMSATVLVFAPVHAAGPLLCAAPQSLSVTRMIALLAIDIGSEKLIVSLSPVSSVFEKPAFAVRTAEIEVGALV